MIFDNLKTVWRRNKKFTVINIFGLALGMFCVILISLWINYETGFDKFHSNYEKLYRVVNNWGDEKDACCPGALAMYMKNKFPDVKNACTYSVSPNIKLSCDEQKNWFTGGIADSSFFTMFSFHFLQGNKNNPFPGPNSTVITNETAKKLFGNTDPIGKQVKMEFEDMVLDLTVSGIIENAPKNSSLQFDFLVTSTVAPQGYFSWL